MTETLHHPARSASWATVYCWLSMTEVILAGGILPQVTTQVIMLALVIFGGGAAMAWILAIGGSALSGVLDALSGARIEQVRTALAGQAGLKTRQPRAPTRR